MVNRRHDNLRVQPKEGSRVMKLVKLMQKNHPLWVSIDHIVSIKAVEKKADKSDKAGDEKPGGAKLLLTNGNEIEVDEPADHVITSLPGV
jgi:hypothetical protein